MKQSMKALLVAGVLGVSATACMTHAADTFTGVTWNELEKTITITHDGTSITMMDRNLGASEAGIGEDSYGYHYQFGGTTGYAVSLTEDGAIAAGFDTDYENYSLGWEEGAQGPCPSGYHVPTSQEWQDTADMFFALNPVEGLAYDETYKRYEGDVISYFNAFKLPFAGYRDSLSSSVDSQGSDARYWSSTAYSGNIAYYLDANPFSIFPQNWNWRANGFSLRCFRDSGSSTSDLSAETEINLTILEGALKLISNVSTITFDSITASLSNTGITASFNDFIEVEDLKGSSSGYYVTVDASDLVSDLASNAGYYTIPKSNLTFNPNYQSSTFKRGGSDNEKVKVGSGTHTFNGEGGFTYIYRQNNTQAGILGKYGTVPSLSINVPANTPAATYRGKIIFTLIDGYSSN